MRGFWRLRSFCLVLLFLLVPAFAKFDQTTGVKTDAETFNGMSDEEVEQLKMQQLQNAYLKSIYDRIKKFDDGDKSSKFDGQGGGGGRYSGYGEAHIQNGDAMVSHEAGANGLESAIEKGALGKTGLSGEARTEAETKAMEAFAKTQLGPDGKTPAYDDKGNAIVTNLVTGQKQNKDFGISAALYDAGPAHPNGPEGQNDPHRVYAVAPGVRTEVEKNGSKYAALTIKDATLAPGKQPNLDLLHKSFSKMEQDKYIMMATDAFAFRSARLEGTDTADKNNKFVIGEYKQIAIDVYSDPKYAGNVKAAEAEIQQRLADRVAEKKVINDQGGICPDGTIKKGGDCGNTGAAKEKEFTAAEADQALDAVLAKLRTSPDGIKKEALKKALGLTKPDPSKSDEKNGTAGDLLARLKLKQLSGIVDRAKLDELYSQAKQNLDPKEQSKIGEYKGRLASNQCLSFTTFCYSSGIGELDEKEAKALEAQGKNAKGADGKESQIDAKQFQKISGDPGGYFTDTRELLFNNFAYAYNRPLSEWKKIVTNADFNQGTDKNFKDGKGTYKEFNKMYDKAMGEAKNIQQNVDKDFIKRLLSAGATPEQIAQVQKNYGTDGKNNFDATKLTHMKLFGQNKNRDAIMMDWRKGANKYINPNYVNTNTSRTPTSKSVFINNPLAPSQSGTTAGKPKVN